MTMKTFKAVAETVPEKDRPKALAQAEYLDGIFAAVAKVSKSGKYPYVNRAWPGEFWRKIKS
jgi:hypothetical protein